MSEIHFRRYSLCIGVLVVVLVQFSAELAATGSTHHLKEIFIGRCWDYQYMKLSRQPRQLWKNCTQIWEIFHEAFAFKDPCKLTFTDYEPYFAAFGESNIVNKSLFWSGTYKTVHSYSDFDLRYTTLEDTFEGSIVNSLNWCGNSSLLRNSSDGVDYTMCPPRSVCDHMTPFWGLASKKFAEKSSGIVRVMVNGTRVDKKGNHVPAYSRQSYFGKYELPSLNVGSITELKILVVHSLGEAEIEKCDNGSVKTLRQDAEDRGIKTKCFDDPDAVKHILCSDHPLVRECLFYLGQRFNASTQPYHHCYCVLTKVAFHLYGPTMHGSWKTIGILFASLTGVIIVTVVKIVVFRTYCRKLLKERTADDRVAIT